jgi:1-deoxy-D-xylulose-5-phosphate reductoisomerase
MKKLAIFGSTGSIGKQTLDVVDELKNIEVVGLVCNTKIEILEEQIKKYNPLYAGVIDEKKANELKSKIRGTKTEIISGIDEIVKTFSSDNSNIILNSFVGIAGLLPTIEFIKKGKDIALANKETLVTGGELVMNLAKQNKVNIFPVDSEHSAIFQCLQGNKDNKIEKLIITASGGPFRGYTKEMLEKVTVEQALKHPNWAMGRKITIDSATLMNKGLEVIEARWLFEVNVDKIQVVVHPQSIVHSAVQYEDGSIIAQLGKPDMKLPIQYALNYPARIKNSFPRLDITAKSLEFSNPDIETFRPLALAYDAIKEGGVATAVLNGANEKAVELFLDKKISFLQIAELIEDALNHYKKINEVTLDSIIEADKWSRMHVAETVKRK